jgi:hypothetical protein
MNVNPKQLFELYNKVPASVRTRIEGAALAYVSVQYGPGAAEFLSVVWACLTGHP